MRDFHVDAGGYRVAVRDSGGDGPAIVLLHGGGANLADWDVVAPLLAREFRVAAYDLHGHGLTETPPERALDVGLPLRELDAVRRALEMDGPLLVGSSLGGGISLRYASTGGSCAGVVAIDGAPLWYSGEQVRPPADPDATREQYESQGLGSIRTEAELDAWLDDAVAESPELPEALIRALGRRGHEPLPDGRFQTKPTLDFLVTLRVMGDAVGRVNGLELFETISVPVLLLMAKRGYSIAGQYTDEHRARIDALPACYPNVTVEWVDAGHLIHWERPDEVAARIAAFAHAAAG